MAGVNDKMGACCYSRVRYAQPVMSSGSPGTDAFSAEVIQFQA